MEVGDKVITPRFLAVTIKKVFDNREEAYIEGFKEPTHYEDDNYDIFGRHIDIYSMEFAAVKK